MAYIELKNLHKTFNQGDYEKVALHNVSLSIDKGDFITIVGGNGAGKSTFLNAVSGHISIDTGDILIQNKSIRHLSEHQRAVYMSRVFQQSQIGTAPRMTVAQNMALAFLRNKKKTLKKGLNKANRHFFQEQLAMLDLGLEERLDTEMGVLSGGQRQAIALLMATMTSPDLLLLDEHTSALDPKMQRKIMTLTDKVVKEKQVTTLMITHSIADALTYGNRMIVLQQGKILKLFNQEEKEQLTPTDVYKLYDMNS